MPFDPEPSDKHPRLSSWIDRLIESTVPQLPSKKHHIKIPHLLVEMTIDLLSPLGPGRIVSEPGEEYPNGLPYELAKHLGGILLSLESSKEFPAELRGRLEAYVGSKVIEKKPNQKPPQRKKIPSEPKRKETSRAKTYFDPKFQEEKHRSFDVTITNEVWENFPMRSALTTNRSQLTNQDSSLPVLF